MTNRCTGHCCHAYTLPYSPEELRENYLAWAEQRPDRNGRAQGREIWLIAPMAIHLGEFDRHPSGEVEPPPGAGTAHYYTCAHLRENGDCGIYEIRPKMCSDYPYGRLCEHSSCTWVDAQQATTQVNKEQQ